MRRNADETDAIAMAQMWQGGSYIFKREKNCFETCGSKEAIPTNSPNYGAEDSPTLS